MQLDWSGILSGPPVEWLKTGVATTLAVTLAGSLLTVLLTLCLLTLRLSGHKASQALAAAVTELFRNTPLLVQILFWYFGAYNLLPLGLRHWINDDHPWATLPGNVPLLSPEFLASAWGLGLFTAVFVAEEIRAGLSAVSPGQSEAALSQGFTRWQTLRWVLLPQALANSFQPVIGQFLNLMKLSSLATAIGLWEITYQVRQIESYNSHALEAFAVGTAFYLAIGLVMGRGLQRLDPAKRRRPALSAAPATPVEVRDAV